MPKRRVMLKDGLRFDKWYGVIATSFAGGTGSSNDPYIISSCEEFAFFAKSVTDGNTYSGAYVSLVTNLDLNDIEWPGIGYGMGLRTTASGKPFQGTFDGNFNVIKNISIKDSTNTHQGLFNYVTAGTIKNIIIENIYRIIRAYGVDATYCYKGLFIGYPVCVTIENCIFKNLRYELHSSGITGTPLSENTLCLIGQEFSKGACNGTFQNCFIYNITGKTNSNFILCGFGRYGTSSNSSAGLHNCYVSGTISTNGEKSVYPVWYDFNTGGCYNCGLYIRSAPAGLKYLFYAEPYRASGGNNVYDSSISGFTNGKNEVKMGKTTLDFTNGTYIISDQYEAKLPFGSYRYYPQLKVFKNNANRYVRELSEMSVKITV